MDPEDRIRHARGQNLPDWIALRSGRLPALPDAVARPTDAAGVRDLLDRARPRRLDAAPVGGGTSVVGGRDGRARRRAAGRRRRPRRDLAGLSDASTRSAAWRRSVPARWDRPSRRPLARARPDGSGTCPQSLEYSTRRRLGGDPLVGPRVDGLRADRGPVRRRPPRDPGRAAGPAAVPGQCRRPGPARARARLGGPARHRHRRRPAHRRRAPSATSCGPTACPTGSARWTSAAALATAGLRLTMVRVVDADRDGDDHRAHPVGDGRAALLRRYLGWRGQGAGSCLVLVGMAGPDKRRAGGRGRGRPAGRATSAASACPALGPAWRPRAVPRRRTCATRCGTPATRWTRWRRPIDWARLPGPRRGPRSGAAHAASTTTDERVHAFSHLSHLYPSGSSLYVTYVVPDRGRPGRDAGSLAPAQAAGQRDGRRPRRDDQPPARRRAGSTRRTSRPRRVALGMAALRGLVERFDPDGVHAPAASCSRTDRDA